VTLNELTLGVERLTRAGNLEGANALLAEASAQIGRPMGKVRKAAAPPGKA
jgi:hypothetical protein